MNMVTVLMPVYNGERFLHPAMDSILSQTYSNFEFLIIDNGSTDQTPSILEEYRRKDGRIQVIHREKGLVEALNAGLDQAQGEYAARLDADDISLPTRLEKQVEFMDKHPDIGVCGSWIRCFGELNEVIKYPENDVTLHASLLFLTPFASSSTLIRRSVLVDHDIHFQNPPYSEDYRLWVRLSSVTQFANIPEILVKYRVYGEQTTRAHLEDMLGAALAIQTELIAGLGFSPSEKELSLHAILCRPDFISDIRLMRDLENWLQKLEAANRQSRVYPEPQFRQAIGRQWWHLCYLASPGLLGFMLASPLSRWADMPLADKSIAFTKALLRPIKNRLFNGKGI